MKTKSRIKRFCNCIKSVRSYIKPKKGNKESSAIAICTKSVLQSKGRTLKKFSCRKGKLQTQKMKHH